MDKIKITDAVKAVEEFKKDMVGVHLKIAIAADIMGGTVGEKQIEAIKMLITQSREIMVQHFH